MSELMMHRKKSNSSKVSDLKYAESTRKLTYIKSVGQGNYKVSLKLLITVP